MPPSLAIVNAIVWTGVPRRPWADAVAVTGDRVVAVGSSAEIRKLVAASTRLIDADGQMLVGGTRDPGVPFAAGDFRLAPAIERGATADFTLVDRDLSRIAPEMAGDARVVMTIAGGRIAWQR